MICAVVGACLKAGWPVVMVDVVAVRQQQTAALRSCCLLLHRAAAELIFAFWKLQVKGSAHSKHH